jgi:dolichol kinase
MLIAAFISIYKVPQYQLLISLAVIGFIYFSIIKLENKKLISDVNARSLIHFLIATITVVFAPLAINWVFSLTAIIFLIIYLIRPPQYLRVTEKKENSYGEIFYSITLIVLPWLSLPHHVLFFQLSLIVLAISDPLAMYVGVKYPVIRNSWTNKSFGGSVIFFTTGIIVTAITVAIYQPDLLMQILPKLILICFVATVIEQVSIIGSDNLTVPICIISLLYLPV